MCAAAGPPGWVALAVTTAVVAGCVYVVCPGAEQRRRDTINVVDTLINQASQNVLVDTAGAPAVPPQPPPPPNNSHGPGNWEPANEAMSDRARAYQQQITGRSGQVYRVNGVKFDGYRNGTLLDAKGPGYANFFENGLPKPWFKAGAQELVAAAKRQIVAARGMAIEWHVAEQEAANAIRVLLQNNNVTGIRVVYTPPAP